MSDKPENPSDETSSSFERRARELFADRVANMDAPTRSKLTQARHAALEAGHRSPLGSIPARWWFPAGGAAGAVLAAILFFNIRGSDSSLPATSESAMDDVEIVASADSLELLENVDFYSWMDAESDSTPGATQG